MTVSNVDVADFFNGYFLFNFTCRQINAISFSTELLKFSDSAMHLMRVPLYDMSSMAIYFLKCALP